MSNFIKTNFKPKYDQLLKGEAFDDVFSKIDCFIFYDEMDKVDQLKIPQEERQKAWDECRSDLSWFGKDRKITTDDLIKECKSRLFKEWVMNRVLQEG